MSDVADLADATLVSLAKNGSLDAFNSLVDRHQAHVYGLCRRMLGQPEAAEDATQETFLAAFRGLAGFQEGNFQGWLLRIAANQCRDEYRRRGRRISAGTLTPGEPGDDAIDIPDSGETAESAVLRSELGANLEQLLLEVPFEQRQAVVLVDIYELSYEEAARLLDISLGTLKSRIHRGRERLRRLVLAHPELFGEVRRLGK
ncbi:MAG: RNA polymerase sigma factor [Dehalococcoidia bacterium]